MKELALAKMLEEMNKPHAQALDTLHNLLCVCDDNDVYTGILKDGKSIDGAYEYMREYGRKNQSARSYGMDGTLALQIVKDYLNDTSTTPEVKEAPKSEYRLPKNVTGVGVVDAPKPKKAKEEVNMSIFDFMEQDDQADD